MFLRFEEEVRQVREVMFTKVKGHGSDENNEVADQLAKSVLEKRGIKIR